MTVAHASMSAPFRPATHGKKSVVSEPGATDALVWNPAGPVTITSAAAEPPFATTTAKSNTDQSQFGGRRRDLTTVSDEKRTTLVEY